MTESKKMEQIIYEEIVTKEGVTFNSDGKKHIERAMEEYSSLQCRERDERIRELETLKRDYFELWNPVDEYVRNLPELKLGDSVSSKALLFLKERSELQDKVEELYHATESMMNHNKVQQGLLDNERKLRSEAESKVEIYEKVLEEAEKLTEEAFEKLQVCRPHFPGLGGIIHKLKQFRYSRAEALSSNKQG